MIGHTANTVRNVERQRGHSPGCWIFLPGRAAAALGRVVRPVTTRRSSRACGPIAGLPREVAVRWVTSRSAEGPAVPDCHANGAATTSHGTPCNRVSPVRGGTGWPRRCKRVTVTESDGTPLTSGAGHRLSFCSGHSELTSGWWAAPPPDAGKRRYHVQIGHNEVSDSRTRSATTANRSRPDLSRPSLSGAGWPTRDQPMAAGRQRRSRSPGRPDHWTRRGRGTGRTAPKRTVATISGKSWWLIGCSTRRSRVARCRGCHTPRCGYAEDPDPCVRRRHHDGDHLLESGLVTAGLTHRA